jgi:exopolyphosphatase/guanosine-5'-triphosphate,3'-diphosphate pyrophosphatase
VLAAGDVVYYIDAFLSFKLKNTYPVHDKNLLIVELGTGSLDISLMRKGFTVMNTGLSIGTLRLRQLMDKLEGSDEENREALKEYIENEFIYLKKVFPTVTVDDIILIDENYAPYLSKLVSTISADSKFYQLSKDSIDSLMSVISDRNKEDISRSYKLPMQIAETISPYALIVSNLFPLVDNRPLHVFETSLAEAVLANLLLGIEISKKYDKTNQLISMARFICQRYNADLDHAKQVAAMSRVLFDGLKGIMGLSEKESIYLILAAYLHDIGMFINNRSHHKHTEYILSYLSLFRMTSEEMKIIACVARYHRKSMPSNDHFVYNTLPLDKRLLVQKLSALLRIANALDRGHRRKVKKLEVAAAEKGDINILVYTQSNFVLEQVEFQNNKNSFEEITGNQVVLQVKYEV